jgi:hypothetical protein
MVNRRSIQGVLAGMILVSLSLFLASHAPAQEARGPKMALPEQSFDFEEVLEGVVIDHTFQVLNQGDETLEIQRISTG